jgi:hypothetical protein
MIKRCYPLYLLIGPKRIPEVPCNKIKISVALRGVSVVLRVTN